MNSHIKIYIVTKNRNRSFASSLQETDKECCQILISSKQVIQNTSILLTCSHIHMYTLEGYPNADVRNNKR